MSVACGIKSFFQLSLILNVNSNVNLIIRSQCTFLFIPYNVDDNT